MRIFIKILNYFFSFLLVIVIVTWLLKITDTTIVLPEKEVETYNCDSLENGAIVEGKVHDGLLNTTYILVICDEASTRDDSENWIAVSPNTYSDYEQGKIDHLENWED